MQTYSNINFTGSSARALKGVFMSANWAGLADNLRQLEPKTGLKVFTPDSFGAISSRGSMSEAEASPYVIWAQDLFSIGEKKLYLESRHNPDPKKINEIGEKLQSFFGLKIEPYNYHIQGGNYITTEYKGNKEVLIGDYEPENLSKTEIAKRFDVDNVVEVPQVAAHLDAFMFVDDKKRAFVCDDELMLSGIAKGLNSLGQYVQKNFYNMSEIEKARFFKLGKDLETMLFTFLTIVKRSPYSLANEAIKALDKAGYETIRIPARLYTFIHSNGQIQHQYGTNFANAILHKNRTGDTVLITNDSANDVCFGIGKEIENKIGFSFKKMFIDSIAPYIKKENVHFVQGENYGIFKLLSNLGGIHCASSEIR